MSFLLALATITAANSHNLRSELSPYVEARVAEFASIPEDRRQQLDKIAEYVQGQLQKGQPVRVLFVCTHNSRRSHLAQVWAKTAAAYYGLAGIDTFSGGTEATAFNQRTVDALKRAGFDIAAPATGENPHYLVRYHSQAPAMECFSKVYNQDPNPKEQFCVVMTCDQADKACPFVAGATLRVAIPYEDPKAFDGTPLEASKYDERCQQIAREMLFIFAKVATH